MSYSLSETSEHPPLQLQIEAQVAGKQQLAYLPTGGPSLDFYYLNYRPAYRAGESSIDFWMLTPKGTLAPETASLELYDEFGNIRLAVLVPEGTRIPQVIANKNEPFLWKSWPIPKSLKADFDFSEKFRVVLKTSDSKTVVSGTNAPPSRVSKPVKKRLDALFEPLVNARNQRDATTTTSLSSSSSSSETRIVVQDRQFRIKGLKATPGGQPNPAKLHINPVAQTSVPGAKSGVPYTPPSEAGGLDTSGSSNGYSTPLSSNNNDEDKPSPSSSSNLQRDPFLLTLAAMVIATVLFC